MTQMPVWARRSQARDLARLRFFAQMAIVVGGLFAAPVGRASGPTEAVNVELTVGSVYARFEACAISVIAS